MRNGSIETEQQFPFHVPANFVDQCMRTAMIDLNTPLKIRILENEE
jgi:hypothetical protein